MLSLRNESPKDAGIPRAQTEHVCWVVGLLFVGIVLAFQPDGLDQFLLPKFLILPAGVPLVIALVVAGRAQMKGDPMLIALVSAFLAWSVVVPMVHASNRVLHGAGAVEALLVSALFVGALRVRSGGLDSHHRLFRLMTLPVLLVAPLALAQGLGLDPMRLVFDLSSTRPGRWQVLTTLGNPSWTAEVLVLLLPLALAAWAPSPRWRAWRLWILVVVCCAGVAVTGSRGALIGLVAGGVIGWRLGLVRRIWWIASGGLIAVCIVVATAGPGRLVDLNPLTGRLGLWASGVHLVRQAPVTGWGLKHTALILPVGLKQVVAGLNSNYYDRLPTILVDRLDQDLLQVAVERGLPAAILLVLIWFRGLRLSFGRFREGGRALDGAVVAALSVFGVLSLISAPLHTPATAALFWILLGFAAGTENPIPQGGQPDQGPWWAWAPTIAGSVVAVAVLGLVWVPILKTNAVAGAAHRQLNEGGFEDASRALAPVVANDPWMTAASIDSGKALVASGNAAEALVVIDDAQVWASSEWFQAIRARALVQLGLEDQARRELKAGLDVVPRSPVLLETQAELGLE